MIIAIISLIIGFSVGMYVGTKYGKKLMDIWYSIINQ